MWHLVISITIAFCQNVVLIAGSNGDRSNIYQKCLYSCVQDNCHEDGAFKATAVLKQDIWCRALQWTCRDECIYHCMWQTVQQRRALSDSMPKFYGKWPFKRFIGAQEPAAAFASLLNLAANAHMYLKIRREFPVKTMPLVILWHIFAFVCMNAWVWSTIFHTRDKPFTEFMDYASALSMVMGLFMTAVIRIFHRKRKVSGFLLIMPLVYYILHVQYLYTGRIDYDYNMLVNVIMGAWGSVLWLGWSCVQWRAGRRHAVSMVGFTLASAAALSLELLDFPPTWGWDAHALWHLTTAPLPLLFYKFVIDDLRYLQSGQYDKLI